MSKARMQITEQEKAQLRRDWPMTFADLTDDELFWMVDKTIVGAGAIFNIRVRALGREIAKALYVDMLVEWLSKRLTP